MRKYLVLLTICIYSFVSNAQNVGIGTPNPQNKLHVAGGLRLDTLTGVNGAGLLRHDANGVVYGIKFSGNISDVLRGDGTFGSGGGGSVGWLLNGNSGTNPATNFLGTTDNQPIILRVNNIRHGYVGPSIFLGSRAGLNNVTTGNVGIGTEALLNNSTEGGMVAVGASALKANTTGYYNVAVGNAALQSNNTGSSNTATGFQTLAINTSGYDNSAFGSGALLNNGTGYFNTAMGSGSAIANQTGHDNTALGYSAMYTNTNGSFNTSVGAFSLYNNNGGQNAAVGYKALEQNTVGIWNTAMGFGALQGNTQSSGNTAFGTNALNNNGTSVGQNSAFGYNALQANTSGHGNTAVGNQAALNNVSGRFNTAIGFITAAALPNNVENTTCIGYSTGWNTTSSNQVNIGNFSVTWIGGQTGWFHYSDKRIKNDIKADVPGLAFITRLKPISYHVDIDKQEEIANAGKVETNSELIRPIQKDWKGKYDVEKIKMTGFFAQDVEEAATAINYSFNGVHNPKNGGLLSLDYSAFVVPLVKAVQEQQTIIEKQQKLIDELLKRVEALEKK